MEQDPYDKSEVKQFVDLQWKRMFEEMRDEEAAKKRARWEEIRHLAKEKEEAEEKVLREEERERKRERARRAREEEEREQREKQRKGKYPPTAQ
jgi:hypothetical protein